MIATHAEDCPLEGGWLTKCGCFADTRNRLSDDPTCRECRCWLGLCKCVEYHDWSEHSDGEAAHGMD